MSTILRLAYCRTRLKAPISISGAVVVPYRSYASKNKAKSHQADEPRKGRSATADLVPASQRSFTNDILQVEYDKASIKMSTAVEWFRKEVAVLTDRAVGRVTPAILDPVKIALPGSSKESRLSELATVGVREGTNLIITLFEEENMKHVEKAIYATKLPNVVPHKVDARTIKIPIPKPTMEARDALVTSSAKTAETIRVQIRNTRDLIVRKHKWATHSDEGEQYQKLCKTRIKEVDDILAKAKKELGS